MTDRKLDDDIPELNDDLDPESPDAAPQTDVQQPSIVAGVGSSALGSIDIEPQVKPRPDNDGETVGQ